MRLKLKYCRIADVLPVDPKATDGQRKDKQVLIDIDEEDFFDMLDGINPKNLVKYLDMRKINHRDALEINVTKTKVFFPSPYFKDTEKRNKVAHALYNANKRNQRKLNRALEILDSIRNTTKL